MYMHDRMMTCIYGQHEHWGSEVAECDASALHVGHMICVVQEKTVRV